jgi:hypothetical protein
MSRFEGVLVVSELGGAQISTLLESLPGIATVLRSPVADALVNVIRAAARLSEFDIADADELVKYATRRGLLAEDEGERLMTDLQAAHQKKLDRIAARPKAAASKGASGKPKPNAKAKAKAPVKAPVKKAPVKKAPARKKH